MNVKIEDTRTIVLTLTLTDVELHDFIYVLKCARDPNLRETAEAATLAGDILGSIREL